eukprot:COSAG01_NODE_17081_length_1180_cov_1.518964_1_plen_180_part_00
MQITCPPDAQPGQQLQVGYSVLVTILFTTAPMLHYSSLLYDDTQSGCTCILAVPGNEPTRSALHDHSATRGAYHTHQLVILTPIRTPDLGAATGVRRASICRATPYSATVDASCAPTYDASRASPASQPRRTACRHTGWAIIWQASRALIVSCDTEGAAMIRIALCDTLVVLLGRRSNQ